MQTRTATILVNKSTGDNVIAIYPGASMTMLPDEITIQKEAITSSDVILLQPGTNCTAPQQVITLAQENNIPVIINPAPYNDIVSELIQDVDYITPDETEAGLSSGIGAHDLESAKWATEAIHNKGVKNTVIMFDSKSPLTLDGKKFIHSSAFPAVVKNTAGAGDAFNGTLASGLTKGKSLESVLHYASAFASLAVEIGDAPGMPEYGSVTHRVQSIYYQ